MDGESGRMVKMMEKMKADGEVVMFLVCLVICLSCPSVPCSFHVG